MSIEYSTKHSIERVSLRYNRELSKCDFNNIIQIIKSGNSIHAERGRKGNTQIHYVIYKKIPYKIVYNYKHKNVVTFLPFDRDEYNVLLEVHINKKIKGAIKFLKKYGYDVTNDIDKIEN